MIDLVDEQSGRKVASLPREIILRSIARAIALMWHKPARRRKKNRGGRRKLRGVREYLARPVDTGRLR